MRWREYPASCFLYSILRFKDGIKLSDRLCRLFRVSHRLYDMKLGLYFIRYCCANLNFEAACYLSYSEVNVLGLLSDHYSSDFCFDTCAIFREFDRLLGFTFLFVVFTALEA